jgi:hypothetical protein
VASKNENGIDRNLVFAVTEKILIDNHHRNTQNVHNFCVTFKAPVFIPVKYRYGNCASEYFEREIFTSPWGDCQFDYHV